MKKLNRLFAFIICSLCFAAQTNAQGIKLPQPSSTQTLIQDFALGNITLTYSRPSIRGRAIFGGLVPFDKVWRTGANSATIIKFSDEVIIEGKTIPAGEYGLFTIPGKKDWTVIISKGSQQWGAYTYKEADDLARFSVKPQSLKDKVETFTMQFANVYQTSAQLQLMWENTQVSVNLTADIDSRVMASINEAMKGEKKPYFAASQYYYNNNKDMAKALEWVNAAEAEDQKAPWIKLAKAKIQLKAGDKKGAIQTAEAGIKLASELKNEEYVRLNTEFLAEAKK
ncbi:DUF2911 domain-containing protein [Pedobacter sp. P351]|uniref:DUF2911 domain-containing protein n=1 Tax=Pedobacter superstes TaxID=3133441 RepID=UPI0030B75172